MEKISQIVKSETKVVIFDLDGTLYSKRAMSWRMLCAAPRDWRKMLLERRARRALKGKWYGDGDFFYQALFSHIANNSTLSIDEVRRWYTFEYMPLMVHVIGKYYKPAPWVKSFVNECHQSGIRLVVLSDYGHAKEKLHALGLELSLFDWVVSAPELGGLKPAPQLLNWVAEKMGVQPHQCLVIGDREDTDGELARSTNARFYHVKH